MLSHGRAKAKPSSTASVPPSTVEGIQEAPRKMSRAATLRRNWSQRDMKKSLPATLPSFSSFEVANVPTRGGRALGVIPTTTATAAVAPGSTVSASDATAGSSVKTRSRASRATDAISKFLNRRSSDNTTSAAKVSKPTLPATSEERRFWPRRLTSEKKVVPELVPSIAAGAGVHLSPTKEDSVSVATTVALPGSKPSQSGDAKSDALRGPHHTVSSSTTASAHANSHHQHTGKPRVAPNATTATPQPSPQSSHSRHSGASTPRTPSPPLDPPFTPQYTLRKFGNELTVLEKHEVLQYGDIFFFSSLEIKSRRRNGKIYNCAASFAGAKSSAVETAVSGPNGEPSSSSQPVSAAAATELFNDGYDDERGDYLLLAQDHLAFRFEVLHVLGCGSFGQVVCCLDHQTQQQVAVKIIRNRKKYKEQSLIEVQILSQLQIAMSKRSASSHSKSHRPGGAPNARIVKMHEYFLFRNHLCISFELLGINLYEYLKLRFFQGVPMVNIRDIASQLVATLKLLHAQRVIHCDLKPENILIKPTSPQSAGATLSSSPSASQRLLLLSAENATTAHANVRVEEICLIDFGSSCLETTAVFTYIQSRFYRSPEVILGFPYSTAIDMWSLGCILVELHTGYPIFAGENETDQLACIMELLGEPSHDLLMHSRRRKHFFTESSSASSSAVAENGGSTGISDPSTAELLAFQVKPFVNSRGRRRTPGSRSLPSAIKSDDAQFTEFVRKCLVMDPRERMTPEQAQRDPWLRASIAGASEAHCHRDVDGYDDLDDEARTRSISLSQEVIGL